MAQIALIGEKLGMTQVWDSQNKVVPVTVLRVNPARIVQIKTAENDGYNALQVTFGYKKKVNKPQKGHFKNVEPGIKLAELPVEDIGGYKVGEEIKLNNFKSGDKVDVTAVSKGKGFAGAMKRHNFKGQGAAHGNHKKHRSPGSIGACATPARVFKGMKMAGHMGASKVTVLNLEVITSDTEREMLLVKGAVPGPKGGFVLVRNSVRGKNAG
jgi:large subunit ribosomal protein L3